jgi:hypothetical protein
MRYMRFYGIQLFYWWVEAKKKSELELKVAHLKINQK